MSRYGLTRDALKRWQTNRKITPVGKVGKRNMNLYLDTDIEEILRRSGKLLPGQHRGQEPLPAPQESTAEDTRCVCGLSDRVVGLERQLAESERDRREWRTIAQMVMNKTR